MVSVVARNRFRTPYCVNFINSINNIKTFATRIKSAY